MSKLKNIIKQLSVSDFQAIFDSLMESNAEKSALLLKFMREKQLSDSRIMEELNVNSNAYYTLRSRLNQKIEEHLLQQMETPRITLLKKVATINEILFTKKKGVSIATLRKLEKELMDYDLANELTVIYKNLKKFHVGTPDYFTYSQLYNKHVAYMLAVDKAEDLMSQYFYRYGEYILSGSEIEKHALDLLRQEIENVTKLYQSHRLYVFQNCVDIFHHLFTGAIINAEEIETVFDKVNSIFDLYHLDATYYHLKPVFEYLSFEYYYRKAQYKHTEATYDELNESSASLLSNYQSFTFPPQFLLSKLQKKLQRNEENELCEENKKLFEDFEVDKLNVPQYVIYTSYRALSCYYAKKYDEAARWINQMLNEQSLKKNPNTMLEVKMFLALQYCLMKDNELYNQLSNSVLRQVRLMGKDSCEHIVLLNKIFKVSLTPGRKGKYQKIESMMDKLEISIPVYFTPFRYMRLSNEFAERLSS